MKCVEVNELIQRYIDQDLDESEHMQLQAHLEICYECKTFYDRLKRVHFDLESLPKVTLPYSIVDTILPELDLIDRNQQQTIPNTTKEEIWRKSRTWIRTIGTLAAGILITIVFMQQKDQNDQLKSSDQSVAKEEMIMTSRLENNSMDSKIESNRPDPSITGFTVANDPSSSEKSNGQVMKSGEAPAKDQNITEIVTTMDQPIHNEAVVNDKPKEKVEVVDSPITVSKSSDGDSNSNIKEPEPPVLNDKGKEYGITATTPPRKKTLTDQETIQATQENSIMVEMTTLISPNDAYLVNYTEQQIEVMINKEATSLYKLNVNQNEYFSDVQWIDDTNLQYTRHTSSENQIWVLNVITGESELQNEK